MRRRRDGFPHGRQGRCVGRYDDFFRTNVLVRGRFSTAVALTGAPPHLHEHAERRVQRPRSRRRRRVAAAHDRVSEPVPADKALAERAVLAANSPALRTVACVRTSSGAWRSAPRAAPLAKARAGRLRIVGTGRNRVDLVHVENAVDAHLLAEAALTVCHLLDDKQDCANNLITSAFRLIVI